MPRSVMIIVRYSISSSELLLLARLNIVQLLVKVNQYGRLSHELKAHPSSNAFLYRLVPPILDKVDC